MSSYSTITFDAIGKDAQLFRTKQSENQMTLSLYKANQIFVWFITICMSKYWVTNSVEFWIFVLILSTAPACSKQQHIFNILNELPMTKRVFFHQTIWRSIILKWLSLSTKQIRFFPGSSHSACRNIELQTKIQQSKIAVTTI